MPKKIRELKKMLQKAGFEQEPKRGKGSHTVWKHLLELICKLAVILVG